MSEDEKDTKEASEETQEVQGAQEVSEKAQEVQGAQEPSGVELPAFYGVKEGMTRVFDKDGRHVPVTVIRLIPNVITQVKTSEHDGYEAYQLGYYEKRDKLLNKSIKGHLAKAKVKNSFARFSEVRVDSTKAEHIGGEVSTSLFAPQTVVDVTGVSRGKGFQGVIKRHNFSQGPMAHGSKFHRTGGSIGNRATPGRVWKNKRMPGHMGSVVKTVQNLSVVEVNNDKGYMLIRGAVPGENSGFVRVSLAVKKRK